MGKNYPGKIFHILDFMRKYYTIDMKIQIKTTPENVNEANRGLFYSDMNLPEAARHCGMTQKEMRLTFFEYLKYHPITYGVDKPTSK